MSATIRHYDENARAFFDSTRDVDMTPLYERFLPWVPAGGAILDAGCGSGRDTLAFRERGYRVTAFDASPELARLAERHTGQAVHVLRFEELEWQEAFNGIWACASLLHVPEDQLPEALHRLTRALKPCGVVYASFKYGQGERLQGGRSFTDLDEERLARILAGNPDLAILGTWTTGDKRPGREEEVWLNTLLQRQAGPESSTRSR
jgi:SAM-dependent methyltransferase